MQWSTNSQYHQLLAMGIAQRLKIVAWAVPAMPKAVVASRSSCLRVGSSASHLGGLSVKRCIAVSAGS